MAKTWSEQEYKHTDAAYQTALDRKARGEIVSRGEIIRLCKHCLPERDASSIGAHLGNLSEARRELGLAVLDEVAAFANRPAKLVAFLKQKYHLR